MGAAAVKGDIAANGANRLAGWVGRIIQPILPHRLADVQVDHARLDNGNALLRVDSLDAIHAIQSDDQPIGYRQRPA